MAPYSLNGRPRHHDFFDAVSLLAETVNVIFLLLQFKAYIKLFIKVFTKTYVNISNELNFSDIYQSVNYIGSLRKFTGTPSGFIHSASDSM